MITNDYKLYVTWSARRESPEECAQRLAGMLEQLSSFHPAFGRWNRQGASEAAAQAPLFSMPPRIAELTEIFKNGRHYADGNGALLADLGYSFSAWNGRTDACGLSMRVSVGNYRMQVPKINTVRIEFANARPGNETLLNAAMLSKVLLAVATAWDYQGWLLNSNDQPLRPWGGWITYLSQQLARNITPPPQVEVEAVSRGGMIMFATQEQFDAGNPAHVAAADAIQHALHPDTPRPKPNLRLID